MIRFSGGLAVFLTLFFVLFFCLEDLPARAQGYYDAYAQGESGGESMGGLQNYEPPPMFDGPPVASAAPSSSGLNASSPEREIKVFNVRERDLKAPLTGAALQREKELMALNPSVSSYPLPPLPDEADLSDPVPAAPSSAPVMARTSSSAPAPVPPPSSAPSSPSVLTQSNEVVDVVGGQDDPFTGGLLPLPEKSVARNVSIPVLAPAHHAPVPAVAPVPASSKPQKTVIIYPDTKPSSPVSPAVVPIPQRRPHLVKVSREFAAKLVAGQKEERQDKRIAQSLEDSIKETDIQEILQQIEPAAGDSSFSAEGTATVAYQGSKQDGKPYRAMVRIHADRINGDLQQVSRITDLKGIDSIADARGLGRDEDEAHKNRKVAIEFPGGRTDLPPDMDARFLIDVFENIRTSDDTRIELQAYSERSAKGAGATRMLSYYRAESVKEYLVANNIDPDLIDIRALGNKTKDGPHDRVDIVFTKVVGLP